MTHKIRGGRVEEYAYYVNKLSQKVGLETEYDVKLWRHKDRTPQTNYHHTPLNEPPQSKFSAYATAFAYHSSGLAAGLYTIGLSFYKYISLMSDDRLERKRKGSSKNRNAIWKTCTDSRFYKSPKWKRETSFRAVASAVRESAVCVHRSFAA